MPATEYAIKAMGFTLHDPPQEITISKYYCLKVYSITGIYYDNQDNVANDVLNDYCKFGIGNNLNKICRMLTGDDLDDDVERWANDKRGHAPYLMTLTTTNLEFKISCKWLKNDNDKVITYDSLAIESQNLNSFVQNYEIAYIPLITASLSENNQPIKITHLETINYGVLDNGKHLINIKLEMYANPSVAFRRSVDSSMNSIIQLRDKYISLGESVSRLIYDSMQESDIEAFIYSWTAMEMFVNKQFTSNAVETFPENIPTEYISRIKKLFNDPQRGKKITTIAHKFSYLSIYVWADIDLQDYDDFIFAKNLRDDFIHGKAITSRSMENSTVRLLYIINKIVSQGSHIKN